MCKSPWVLPCLMAASHGGPASVRSGQIPIARRHGQQISQKAQSKRSGQNGGFGAWNTVAMMLLAFNPAAGWRCAGPVGCSPEVPGEGLRRSVLMSFGGHEPPSSELRSSPTLLKQLEQWCLDAGVSGLGPSGALQVGKASEGGLGLFATRSIKAGDILLRVPLRLALADRLLPGLEGASDFGTPWPKAPWQVTLAARLSQERAAVNGSSPWHHWLAVLPEDGQGLPLGEAAHVQYAPAREELTALHRERAQLADRTAVVFSSNANTKNAAAHPAAFSAASVEQSITLANTRAFLLELMPGDPWASCHAFVPLLDMFNHASLAQSHVEWSIDDADQCITVLARRPAESGEQLTLAYDPMATNDDYAIYHGFTPSSNEYDDVELFDSLEEAIAWHRAVFAESQPMPELEGVALSLAAMPSLEGSLHMRRVGVASGGPKGKPLWLRATEADSRLIATFRLLAGELRPPPEGPEAEAVHAASALVRRCKELLASFSTTLSEDLVALGLSASDINEAVAEHLHGKAADGLELETSMSTTTSSMFSDQETQVNNGAIPSSPSSPSEVTLRYRASKKLVLHAAMAWLQSRWPTNK